MVLSYDVGSIPFAGDFGKFSNGLRVQPLLSLLSGGKEASDRSYFEEKTVESFIDKAKAGISIPNYPQFRDMSEMFLNSIAGVAKTEDGYRVVDKLSVSERKLKIPEVSVLEERASEIHSRVGGPFSAKICVTGPYTLSSLFTGRESRLFVELGKIISRFVECNVFSNRFGRVALVAIDEPAFGLVDDPLLDYGQSGRDELLKAWEIVFHQIRSNGVKSIMHLHSTSNGLFWQARSLDIVESHVNDSLYASSRTKARLEAADKFLKASICITDFDALIRETEAQRGLDEAKLGQRVADVWTAMREGKTNPNSFLESTDTMSRRLKRIVSQCGDRVIYAGPECGLRSFPTYDSALECLRRAGEAAQNLPR